MAQFGCLTLLEDKTDKTGFKYSLSKHYYTLQNTDLSAQNNIG